MNRNIRICIVDDHAMFRESLVRLLENIQDFTVVARCATLQEAEQALDVMEADIVLLDYDLGVEVGTDFLDYLQQRKHSAKVLLVTGGMKASATVKAIDLGAMGLILKHNDPQLLIKAIRRVDAGETWWDTELIRSLGAATDDSQTQQENIKLLTERQRLVLRFILDGLTNKEIAANVGSSETSIKATIQELFHKAGVRTRSQLVRVAIERYSAEWLSEE